MNAVLISPIESGPETPVLTDDFLGAGKGIAGLQGWEFQAARTVQ
jgi:hypothetical protein